MAFAKIKRLLLKIRLRPIQVFVFHAVGNEKDADDYMIEDWNEIDSFRKRIICLKQRYRFISIEEAYSHLTTDIVRLRRYAVLTCDDGYLPVLSLLPFLKENNIPLTLFINPKYLDGVSRRDSYKGSPQYITQEQLSLLDKDWVKVGMHGFEHNDASTMPREDFVQSIEKCINSLDNCRNYIPYFAYPWGRYNQMTQQVLDSFHIIPVFCDGNTNCIYRDGISRKPIDSYYFNHQS